MIKLQEVRGRIQEEISVRQIFNPTLFVMHNGILCYNRHSDPAKPYDAIHVCVPAVKLEEVFKICHEGVAGGPRGVAGTLHKFQRTVFAMSACEKIRRLVDRCNRMDLQDLLVPNRFATRKQALWLDRVLIPEHFSVFGPNQIPPTTKQNL